MSFHLRKTIKNHLKKKKKTNKLKIDSYFLRFSSPENLAQNGQCKQKITSEIVTDPKKSQILNKTREREMKKTR